jgi:methyl-accepting chemotaxis protein
MFKNLKVGVKLTIMGAPALVALIILGIVSTLLLKNTYEDTSTTLYEELYIANDYLLNADRDFHQAVVAELQMINSEINTSAASPLLMNLT